MVAQSVPARTKRYVRAGSSGLLIPMRITMYTVYVLKDKNGKLYKGMTNNLARRLSEHRSGHTITTARMTDLQVIYEEKFESKSEARKREIYFKTAAGRRFLKDKVLGW